MAAASGRPAQRVGPRHAPRAKRPGCAWLAVPRKSAPLTPARGRGQRASRRGGSGEQTPHQHASCPTSRAARGLWKQSKNSGDSPRIRTVFIKHGKRFVVQLRKYLFAQRTIIRGFPPFSLEYSFRNCIIQMRPTRAATKNAPARC